MNDFNENEFSGTEYTGSEAGGAMPQQPEERSAYSDAGFESSTDAAAVPRSYHCAAEEKPPKKQRAPRKGMPAGAVIAMCLVCAILGGLAAGFLPGLLRSSESVQTAAPAQSETAAAASGTASSTVINVAAPGNTQVTTRTVVSGDELSPTQIYYDLALNQVVGVTTEITYTNYWGYTTTGAVTGSGFIISSDGYILTNYHVIEDAVKGSYDVQVLTHDGNKYIAAVVGYESDNDVAVLKIDASGLSAATIGNSDEMLVGQPVYAVGNPLGELEYTMTDGMVSALDRVITSRDSTTGGYKSINMFQISAAINSGNSGGPIYNSRGEVIGIATAKYSDTGVESLGFAIPINDAMKIANDLISDGYVRGKAYMGIQAGTVTAAAAQYYGLVQGAIVASVDEGGCAERAGLKESDIIVALDDTPISSMDELISAKKNYSAGDSAVLKVYRGGQYLELTITFDEATPQEAEEPERQETTDGRTQQSGGEAGSYEEFFREFFGSSPFGR